MSSLELVSRHIAKNTKALLVALGIGALWGLYIYRKSRNLWQLMGFTSIAPVNATYDYIIVGGGTAGCILATRLAENRNCSVLLLDAGNASLDDYSVQSPLLWTLLWFSPAEWNLKCTKQSALNDRKLRWHRSRLLGGNGTNDPLIHLRGDPADYDQWESEFGLQGWSYKDLIPFFKKSETFIGPQTPERGTRGELSVVTLKSLSNIAHAFLDGCAKIGISLITGDYNAGVPLSGAGACQLTIGANARQYGANAFLRPAFLKRRNLSVRTEAVVTRVLVENSTAVGVEWSGSNFGDANRIARAKKEVILAAGPVGSAQLLLLSGIGPEEHLQQMEIDVVQNLPVGENLQDQLLVSVDYKVKHLPDSIDHLLAKPMEVTRNLLRYIYFHTGRLIQPMVEALAFEPKVEEDRVPSIQYVSSTRNFVNCSTVDAAETVEGFSVLSVLLHPKSKGTLRLKSKNPSQSPVIDPNYLNEEDDRYTLVQGAKRATEIVQASSFDPIRSDPILTEEFGERFKTQCDDAFWSEYIKARALAANNPIGTCRMGTNPENSVVNERLQVHNVRNLRVADASVIPSHVSAWGSRATTMVIAEKAATLILEDFDYESKKKLQ